MTNKKKTIKTSLENTKELRQMIIDNPDLPLVIFAGEYAWGDNGYGYELTQVNSVRIEELYCYCDYYCDEEEYTDSLRDDLGNEENYKDMLDDEFDKMIESIVENTKFTKCIVIYVG